MKFPLTFCLIIFFFKVNAQSFEEDLSYLINQNSSPTKVLVKKQLPVYQRYNPVFWFFNGSLSFYQKVISPQISANCLYEQSCSRFSRACIQEFGILKGLALTADRLSRCNRIAATGINSFRITETGKVIDSPKMYKTDEPKNTNQ